MNATARVMPASAPGESNRAFPVTNGSLAAAQGRLQIVRDPLRVMLFILTVLTVSRVHQQFSALAHLRPALLLVIAITAYAYLNPRQLAQASVVVVWPMRLVATLGVLACFSAVFGISLGRAASFILGSYVKVLIYAFLLALSIRHVKDLFTLVWAYVIGCGILAFFALFVFRISRTAGSDFARLSDLYTYDANDMGVIMMVGLPLTLLLLLSTRRGWRARGLLMLILVGISTSIARSGSRGGFLGFVAVGAAALILANNISVTRRTLMLAAAVVALTMGAPPGYWKQMDTILHPKDDYNYSAVDGRKAVAARGLGYMTKYPLFGLGMNNFSRAECTIAPKLETLNRFGPIRCTPPHNSYIEAGAELGVPGLLVWLSLVVGVILSMLRLRRRLPRLWQRGTEVERFLYGATSFFPLAMIGFAVTAFFVSFAWMDPLYILAAFTTGFFFALREHTKETKRADAVTLPSERHVTRGAPGWRVAGSMYRFARSRALLDPRP